MASQEELVRPRRSDWTEWDLFFQTGCNLPGGDRCEIDLKGVVGKRRRDKIDLNLLTKEKNRLGPAGLKTQDR